MCFDLDLKLSVTFFLISTQFASIHTAVRVTCDKEILIGFSGIDASCAVVLVFRKSLFALLQNCCQALFNVHPSTLTKSLVKKTAFIFVGSSARLLDHYRAFY